MGKINVLKRLTGAPDLPALPANVERLLQELRNPDVDLEKLSREIALDQSVTVKILRIVNSSFYGMPGRIASLRNAVVLLGVQTVQNIVLSISLVDSFRSTIFKDVGLSPEEFWKHTVGTGLICQVLAQRQRISDASDAFVAGLLHDIGKLLLIQVMPSEYSQVISAVRNENLFFDEAEKRYLSADHAAVGGWLLKRWRLPSVLIESTLFHHHPMQAKHPFARIVHVADSLCTAFAVDSGMSDLVQEIDPEIWKWLHLSEGGVDELLQDLDNALQNLEQTVTTFMG